VAHACNPSYSEARDLKDQVSRPSQVKAHKTSSQQKKLGMVGLHLSSQ
jgi:hypothetical protein